MASGSFSYGTIAPATVEEAMALLGDLTRQGELHPLIVAVDAVPPRGGALASYDITDRLRWGALSFRIRYEADVLERGARRIHTVARQKPGTTVDNVTTVTAVEGGVSVAVDVTLTAPALLFRFAFAQAKAAHLELGVRIGRALGAAD